MEDIYSVKNVEYQLRPYPIYIYLYLPNLP